MLKHFKAPFCFYRKRTISHPLIHSLFNSPLNLPHLNSTKKKEFQTSHLHHSPNNPILIQLWIEQLDSLPGTKKKIELWNAENFSEQLLNSIIEQRKMMLLSNRSDKITYGLEPPQYESLNAKKMFFKILCNRLSLRNDMEIINNNINNNINNINNINNNINRDWSDERDFDEKFYPCSDDFRILMNRYYHFILKDEKFFNALSENYEYLIPEMMYLIEFGEFHNDIEIPLTVRKTFGLDFYRKQMKLDQIEPDHKYLTTLLVVFYNHLGKSNNPDVLREELYWMLDLFESEDDKSNLLMDSVELYPGNTPFLLRSLLFENTLKIIERVIDGNLNPMIIMWSLFMSKLEESKELLDPQDYDDLNRKCSQILKFQDPSTGNNLLHEIVKSNKSIFNKIVSILLIIGHEQKFQDTDEEILFEMKNHEGKSAYDLSSKTLRIVAFIFFTNSALVPLLILSAPSLLILVPLFLFVRVFARLLFKTLSALR